MHLISTAVQNRDWLKFTGRIRPSLLPHRSITTLGFSSVVLFPRFSGFWEVSQTSRESLSDEAAWRRWIREEQDWRGECGERITETQFPFCFSKPQQPLPARSPGRIPQHSLHRNLFSATSLPTPRSPDKPVHSADEESSLSSGTNVWQVNFKVAHGVEATESYTTVKKEKCCWINSASNGCVTENTLKIQALCIRRQALWFRSRNREGSLELGLTGVQLLRLEFYDYETCAPGSPI